MGLSAHAHTIVQEAEIHEWLLSGIDDYTLLLSCTIVANKWQAV